MLYDLILTKYVWNNPLSKWGHILWFWMVSFKETMSCGDSFCWTSLPQLLAVWSWVFKRKQTKPRTRNARRFAQANHITNNESPCTIYLRASGAARDWQWGCHTHCITSCGRKEELLCSLKHQQPLSYHHHLNSLLDVGLQDAKVSIKLSYSHDYFHKLEFFLFFFNSDQDRNK